MMDSLGAITWWGFSPAINLMEYVDKDEPTINILLVGSGDLRHILTTIAELCQNSIQAEVNFYVLEHALELYARHMLLLALSLESQDKMGLQEKCELFLETYGNILIRQQTSEYIQSMSNLCIRMITDFDILYKHLPILDLSLLKFKERDFLEGIFKFWRNPDHKLFEVEKYWDIRMRKIMGTRYDARKNTYDWDYYMKLCERQADVINRENYRNWRHTGQAFEIREGTYDIPNKTLSSGFVFKRDGERHLRRGYWGDMVVGPYVALALQSSDPDMFKKQNGAIMKSSEEIAAFNITSLLYAISHKKKYVTMERERKPEMSRIVEVTDEIESEHTTQQTDIKSGAATIESENIMVKCTDSPQHKDYECVSVDNVKITFLPLNSLPDLSTKPKYQNFFNLVYLSNSMAHHLVPSLTEILQDKATIIVESAKFMLELRKEQYTAFTTKIVELASTLNCQPVGHVNPDKDVFTRFLHSKLQS